MNRINLLPAMLASLSSMLAVALAYQLAVPPPEYDTPSSTKRIAIPAVSLPKPFAPPPLTEFAEIGERSVFAPERRPFREIVVQVPPPPRTPPAMTLIGVILDGDREVAIAKTGNRSVSLTRGATIDGWNVVAIESDRISLKADNESHEIYLPKPVVSSPAQGRLAGASRAGSAPRPSRTPPPPGYAPGQPPRQP